MLHRCIRTKPEAGTVAQVVNSRAMNRGRLVKAASVSHTAPARAAACLAEHTLDVLSPSS